MKKGLNINMLLVVSIVIIVLAIGLVAILDRTRNKSNSTDVRARAATTKSLTVNATIASIQEEQNTLMVSDLYFTDESRSGEAKNLGSWVVTPPASYTLSSLSPGTLVVIGVESASFMVSKHTLTATSITPQTK